MISRIKRHIIFSTVFILAAAALVHAQDAGQVLRVSVGYTTLKNSTTLSPEKRAEVDRLGKLAQEAGAAGKFGEALKHYYHAITIMRGAEWTAARAFGAALTTKLDRAVLEPGETAQLRLGQLFPLDEKPQGKLAATVTLSSVAGQSQPVEVKKIAAIEPDLVASPLTTEVRMPDVADGNYRLAVRVELPEGEPVIKNLSIHISRGLAAQIAAAKSRVGVIEAKLKANRQDALAAALPSAEYRISLVDLANAGEINFERLDFREQLKQANEMLDSLAAGVDPLAARRGDLRKAYRSKVDNTLQPYRIFLPSGYDRSKSYPLVVALHGMGGDENSYFEVYDKGAIKLEAERRGYIVVTPKGRQPASMYLGAAERDVMDVIAETRSAYNIDPDRIYMTGHSMGGFGSWSVAMNNPAVFAAIAPVAGGGNPLGLAKIAHVPQLVVHGDNDKTVPVDRSRVMVGAAKKLGVEVKYIEVPGGNHVDVVVPTFKDVFDWFDAHRRKSADAKAAGVGAKPN